MLIVFNLLSSTVIWVRLTCQRNPPRWITSPNFWDWRLQGLLGQALQQGQQAGAGIGRQAVRLSLLESAHQAAQGCGLLLLTVQLQPLRQPVPGFISQDVIHGTQRMWSLMLIFAKLSGLAC